MPKKGTDIHARTIKKPGSMVRWWQAAALGIRSAKNQLANGVTAPTLLPNSMPRSRMGLMSSEDAAGDMLAIITETNGAGVRTATVFHIGETRSRPGCDARVWHEQIASTSSPPAAAIHRSRSSTISRPFPMPAGTREGLGGLSSTCEGALLRFD